MRSIRVKIPNKIDLRPAFKRQIDYALSLGICLPGESTVSDASALIDRELDDDTRTLESLLAYAAVNEIVCSSYIGNKALHNLIFDNIKGAEKAAFFCFCIYKFHLDESHQNLHTHQHKDVFESFGNQYVENLCFKTSMDEYYGEELIAFGKSTKVLEDGTKHTIYGGSAQTIAYKMAYEYLENNCGMPK